MGLGASSNCKTISANLDQSSVIKNASYKVVNAACSAYCSWQELIRFALEISRFEPPIVISISSYNDFYHASIGDRFTGEWYLNHDRSIDDLSNYLLGLNENVSLRSVFKNKLLQNDVIKYLYTLYMNTVKLKNFDQDEVRWGYTDVVFRDRENSALNYLHNMGLIKALVSSYGGHFVNIQQPILALVSERNPTDDYSRLVDLHPGLDKALRNFYQRIFNINTSHKIISFPEFEAGHFVDHCHLNDVGQVLMAKLILKTIQPLLPKIQ